MGHVQVDSCLEARFMAGRVSLSGGWDITGRVSVDPIQVALARDGTVRMSLQLERRCLHACLSLAEPL